ncbi:MAG: M16 family metallopeptidase, partial [Candidatus Krumholzibacteriia bacterium]
RSITVDDVKSFYERHFTRANAVVALGGGYPRELPERLQRALEGLPEGEPTRVPKPRYAAIEGRKVLLVAKPGADASISLGFPIDLQRGEREFYALWLANSWLGEHRNSSSHLYQVIRSTRGMNYGDYSYIEAYPEGGRRQKPPTNVSRRQQCFEIWIRTLPNENALFALRAALRELQMLVDDGMTPEEFELRRAFLDKYILHFAETTTQRLGYAVDDRFYGIEGRHLEDFRKTLKELTLDEVNAAIRKHLQYGHMKIAIVTGAAEQLKEQLASDEPTPITYGSPKPDEVLEEDKVIASLPLKIAAADIQIVPVDEMFEN